MLLRSVTILILFLAIKGQAIAKIEKDKFHNSVDSIFVSKTQRMMTLYSKGKRVKTYRISIGQNAKGHKIKQGDNKTPEGLYYINAKNPNSAYYRNLGISYPNEQDRKRAKKLGVLSGGDIKIHGYADEFGNTSNMNARFSYTWGCLAVSNAEMKEIYDLVKVGSKIFIQP